MSELLEIISKMSIEEKISMLTAENGEVLKSYEKYNIRKVTVADGPHGVRIEGNTDANCTSFPCVAALGATWNRKLAYQMGEAIAKDCIKHGIGMILAPGLNIKRVDVCGRNFEYFSEDPVLSGELGAEYINGVQSLGIGTSLKHFAANNQETDRLFVNAEIDERTLREIYLKAFKIAIDKSNPASVMCAYNKLNGILCSEHKQLLTDILKDEWGYEGFIMSDWGCCHNTIRSLLAGLDLQMPCKRTLAEQVKKAYDDGIVSEAVIDNAVYRILKFILEYSPANIEYNREEQHRIAQKIAEESIVLLKNEDNVLPITKEKYKKIVVIGEYAEKPVISGFGSSHVYTDETWIDSPINNIREILGNDIEVEYIPLYSTDKYFDRMHFSIVPQLDGIKDADLVVMFAGHQQSVETEGNDRTSSQLDTYYEFFIKQAYQRNQNIVLVLQTGSTVIPLTWQNKTKGIVQMWLSGEGGGKAIANVLCGKTCPSGKLEESFPYKTRTDIDYPGDGYKVRYDEKLAVGYRYYDKHPDELWYPFGHGLSYTSFEYKNLLITNTDNGFYVEFDISNTGEYDGAEVAQIYVRDNISTVTKSEKDLVTFEKIFLKKGETKKIKINITREQLSYYNTSLKKWVCEPGTYTVLIGSSCNDIRLSGQYLDDSECPYTLNYLAEQMMA